MVKETDKKLSIPRCGILGGEFSPYCTILENISEGVITIDLEKKITFFNRAAEILTGFTRKDAIGQYCFDIFRANICTDRCSMDQVLKRENEPRDVPGFIINKSGDQVPISVSSCPLRADSGQLIGIIEIFRDLTELERLRRQAARTYFPEDIVGRHPKMREIFSFLPDIAESDSPVLIEGPTGSGKELFARAIHNLSSRRNGPFIAINCGALPDTLYTETAY